MVDGMKHSEYSKKVTVYYEATIAPDHQCICAPVLLFARFGVALVWFGFGLALVWLRCGFGVASVWLRCGFGVKSTVHNNGPIYYTPFIFR
jgi:hypothetical protein